jgi:hypothetical protein
VPRCGGTVLARVEATASSRAGPDPFGPADRPRLGARPVVDCGVYARRGGAAGSSAGPPGADHLPRGRRPRVPPLPWVVSRRRTAFESAGFGCAGGLDRSASLGRFAGRGLAEVRCDSVGCSAIHACVARAPDAAIGPVAPRRVGRARGSGDDSRRGVARRRASSCARRHRARTHVAPLRPVAGSHPGVAGGGAGGRGGRRSRARRRPCGRGKRHGTPARG